MLGSSLRAQQAGKAFTDSVLTAKNFPLLTLLQHDRELQALVQKDKVLRRQTALRRQRLERALKQCALAECYARELQWTESEVTAIGNELLRLYGRKKAFRQRVPHLRSGYALYEKLPDTALLLRAWRETAGGLNHLFSVYAGGEAPRYPKIDSISFARSDAAFLQKVQQVAQEGARQGSEDLFFTAPLKAALRILELNGRDEAARFEPLMEGLNAEPFSKIKATRFDAYRYSVILIPGLGPEEPGMALDPGGAWRCEEGVKRWRQGLAPFIVVSGGHVHPFRTPYNEAVEMKKYIVEKLQVPADVVFIEPHARHTTTNLRNTSRLIYRFGLSTDKPVLIVTDSNQSSYIVQRMEKTALRDLNYVPWQGLKKLSEVETEFYPVRACLQADPFDTLDP